MRAHLPPNRDPHLVVLPAQRQLYLSWAAEHSELVALAEALPDIELRYPQLVSAPAVMRVPEHLWMDLVEFTTLQRCPPMRLPGLAWGRGEPMMGNVYVLVDRDAPTTYRKDPPA
jgi:hypothetical protein